MGEREEDWHEIDFEEREERERREEARALSPAGVAEQNRGLLRRYREFRHAADAVAAVWRSRLPDGSLD